MVQTRISLKTFLNDTEFTDLEDDSDRNLEIIVVVIAITNSAIKTRTYIHHSTVLSIIENEVNPNLNIYPNPSKNVVPKRQRKNYLKK